MKKQVIFTIKAGTQSVSILVSNFDQIRALIETTRETESVIARKLGDNFILVKDEEVTFECFNETVVSPEDWDELWRVHVTAESLAADEGPDDCPCEHCDPDHHAVIDEIESEHNEADKVPPGEPDARD